MGVGCVLIPYSNNTHKLRAYYSSAAKPYPSVIGFGKPMGLIWGNGLRARTSAHFFGRYKAFFPTFFCFNGFPDVFSWELTCFGVVSR